jgi:hypothetical protein
MAPQSFVLGSTTVQQNQTQPPNLQLHFHTQLTPTSTTLPMTLTKMSDSMLNNGASSEPNPVEVLRLLEVKRQQYGRPKSLLPLATNNPEAFCARETPYSPEKAVFPISCESLHDDRQIYEREVHPTILQSLEDNLGNLLAIHPVRLGFVYPPSRSEPAITLLLVFRKGSVDQGTAEELLSRLETQISKICETNNIEEKYVTLSQAFQCD